MRRFPDFLTIGKERAPQGVSFRFPDITHKLLCILTHQFHLRLKSVLARVHSLSFTYGVSHAGDSNSLGTATGIGTTDGIAANINQQILSAQAYNHRRSFIHPGGIFQWDDTPAEAEYWTNFYRATTDFPAADEATLREMFAYKEAHFPGRLFTLFIGHLCWQGIKTEVYARIDAATEKLIETGMIERGEAPNKTQLVYSDDCHFNERVT
jgi:hypothetical protein